MSLSNNLELVWIADENDVNKTLWSRNKIFLTPCIYDLLVIKKIVL